MLQNMNNNKEYVTWQKIEEADRAQYYQALLGLTSTSSFVYYVAKKLLISFDITVDGIKKFEQIYGTYTPPLKVKMKWKTKFTLENHIIPLPPPISQRHKDLNMYINIFMST